MKCPFCGDDNIRVIDSRPAKINHRLQDKMLEKLPKPQNIKSIE